jgi:hypothetical protein
MTNNGDLKHLNIVPPAVLATPAGVVDLLEDCGGDLRLFLERAGNPPYPEQALYLIQKTLRDTGDKTLVERWEDALNDYLKIRIRFEQIKVLDRLSSIESASKPNEVLSQVKALLADIFKEKTFITMQKYNAPIVEEDDDDEDELAKVMGG